MTAALAKPTAAEPEIFTDAALIAEIASGHLEALGTLFDRHHRRVTRVLLRTGVAGADVEDIVQATFLAVPKTASTFDGRESAGGWLCGIALRLASRRRRSLGRLLRMLASFGAESPTQYVLNPEVDVANREELERFACALETLTPKKREAFVLVELEGFSAEDVGKALHVNAATIRTRLFHARAELRSAMNPEAD